MKGSGIARIVLIVLFLLFVGLYVVGNSTYYDYNVTSKTRLTEEQIKKFEEDIKNGEKIDLEDYLNKGEKSYDNAISKATLGISQAISSSFDQALSYLFNKLNDAIVEK